MPSGVGADARPSMRVTLVISAMALSQRVEDPDAAAQKYTGPNAKSARESLDEYRLERAFVRLHAAAYIWPPEYAAPQKH